MFDRLEATERRFDELTAEMATPEVSGDYEKLQALAPQPGGGQQDMTDEERAKQREELQKKINDVLNPAQEQRVKEIQLQMRGTRALTTDEVVKELGLSAKQVTDIEAALQVQRPQGGGQNPSEMSQEDRQKMILNEYRLMPWQKEAQELIARHMEDFFFGAGAALPPGYVPQQAK